MEHKPYRIVDGMIYPTGIRNPDETIDEFVGDYWRVWKSGPDYFLEYDEGHFATKMAAIKISKDQFNQLREGTATLNDVANPNI